jgi:hypothetical protein
MAEQQQRPRQNTGPRRGQQGKPTPQQQWTDDLAQQAFSLFGGRDDWYAQRRHIADDLDFQGILARLNHRISAVGGKLEVSTQTPQQAREEAVQGFQHERAAEDISFMDKKAQDAVLKLGDDTRLEKMTEDLRQCESIVKHFESEVNVQRGKLKKEMEPFFNSAFETPMLAQDNFERIASSTTPKETLLESLRETNAHVEIAEKMDLDGLLRDAQGDSRIFAQIALKQHPDLFGDLRGKVKPDKFLRKGGPDSERLAAYDIIRNYHPKNFAEAEIRLAEAEISAVKVQEKFQSIDRTYRKALEVELLKKLDMYNGLMEGHLQQATQEPSIQPDMEEPAQEHAPAVENPHGFKEVKRPRFMTEKQIAAAQKRFAKAFPDAASPDQSPVEHVPMDVIRKQERAAAKAAKEAAAPQKAEVEVPEVASEQAAEAPQQAQKSPEGLHATRDDEAVVPERARGMPELRATRDEPEVLGSPAPSLGGVTREEAERAGKGHLHKGAALSQSLTFDEMKEGVRDLDARIQAAKAHHDQNPAIGTDKWWGQSR